MEPLEFTERLRGVLSDAREEASRLHQEHVGTEHLLFSLLADAEREGAGAREFSHARGVLDRLGVDRQKLRQVLDETVLPGRAELPKEQLAYTSRARAVLEMAISEARVLKADAVSTEHLLLGLIREERGIAAQVLLDFGVTAEKVRAQLR
ncbi:MAG TPA: Clp protease N-terminal domain-containing protein [Gemmatimonadales bacterium]|jgi:ATP-dependent Clp protease ATP-binding subunit ClpC|nr:Clp protease N-terminal domain-containing protein [Gemmatimonadales bacterium]